MYGCVLDMWCEILGMESLECGVQCLLDDCVFIERIVWC